MGYDASRADCTQWVLGALDEGSGGGYENKLYTLILYKTISLIK